MFGSLVEVEKLFEMLIMMLHWMVHKLAGLVVSELNIRWVNVRYFRESMIL